MQGIGKHVSLTQLYRFVFLGFTIAVCGSG